LKLNEFANKRQLLISLQLSQR